ncbi:anthranilate synthase component I family protein [Cohnella candidum]|uniref:Anthranilate synthase component I family protein n=1 Tax=Cohnella candidum TaxID=2674991 RepID=A0A3G3K4F8_9BACL|nr:anthranilate synthase component I family protein [Cohnella candidum]AYQ74639.1 anthranilate synthase component I family protein [Cohnella candidum]
MNRITLEQWREWQGSYTLLPYVRMIRAAEGRLLPVVWDRFWSDASAYGCVLESGKGARYTMAGLQPVEVIEGKGNKARISSWDGKEWADQGSLEGAPLDLVRSWMTGWSAPRPEGLPDCCGGAFGFWSYDTVRSLEKLPVAASDDLGLPDFAFQRYERLWIADHREQAVYLAVHMRVPADAPNDDEYLERLYVEAERAADEMERQWRSWCAVSEEPETESRLRTMRSFLEEDLLQIEVERIPGLATSMSKGAFENAVRRIQDYIAQGDAFQVNLSLRQSVAAGLPAEELYEWLRLVNPSPYMGMLRTPNFALVSASPELLVKLDEGKLSTRPIAGTRRRGRTPEEDKAMEDELRSNEKERAEHVMLVDLERNDLGRVAAYGTVKVPELMTVERYSHVMHLVSQVEARLSPGKDAFDVVAAVFPGGTITGAPKIRTMEIIEELEPVRRGPYTGSMGWIDYAGNMEFNIIIRTIAVKDGVCHIQAGAGIVIDSDPNREFYECLNKAKALWKAVQYGQRYAEGQDRPSRPPA